MYYLLILLIAYAKGHGRFKVFINEVTSNSILISFNVSADVEIYSISTIGGNHVKLISNHIMIKASESVEKNITGLTSNTLYTVDVKARINSTYALQGDLEYIFIPQNANELTISNIHATNVFATNLTLVWDALPQVHEYTVRPTSTIIRNVTSTTKVSHTVTGIAPNTLTTFIIQAYLSNHDVNSRPISVRTLAKETDVRNLVASFVYKDRLSLLWDESPFAKQVEVSSQPNTLHTTSLNYITLTNLNQGSSFTVKVGSTSLNVSLNQETSPVINNLVAEQATNDSMFLTWDSLPHTNLYQVTYIRYIENKQLVRTINTHAAEISLDQSLAPDSMYSFQVTTYYEYSMRTSPMLNVSTLPQDGNKIVNIVASNVFKDSVSLMWSGRTSKATKYSIEVSTNPQKIYTAFTNRIAIYDLKTNVGDTHVFTIKLISIDSVDLTSDISGTLEVTVPASTGVRPGINSFIISDVADDRMTITWKPVEHATKYSVVVNSDSFKTAVEISAKSRTYQFTNLTANVEYSFMFTVHKRNEVLPSKNFNITTGAYKDSIHLQVVNVYSESIDLYWNPINGVNVTYEIITEPKRPNFMTTNEIVSKNKVTLWSLNNLSTYKITVKVSSMNGSAVSNVMSEEVTVQLREVLRHIISDVTVAEVGATKLTIKWQNVGSERNYHIYYREKEGNETKTAKAFNAFGKGFIEDLKADTEYIIWVATATTPFQLKSSAVTTKTLVEDATGITRLNLVTAYSKSFDIKWDAYPQAVQYRVQFVAHSIIMDKIYDKNYATVYTDYGNREYKVFVYVQKRGSEMLPPKNVTSETINVTLPQSVSSDMRPSLYLWVENVTSSTIEIRWNALDEQAEFKVETKCTRPPGHVIFNNVYPKGLNRYTMRESGSGRPLVAGTSCQFEVHVININGGRILFDYKSNKVVANIDPGYILTPKNNGSSGGSGGGKSDASATTASCFFCTMLMILSTAVAFAL